MEYEYKVVTAPGKGQKAKGVRSAADRFAFALESRMNEMAAEGWEYVRAETLPCDERKGLTGSQTTYQNILIFKRFRQDAAPLPLDARTTSRPLPEPLSDGFDDMPPPTPRIVSQSPDDANHAPPLGAARDD